MRVSASVIIAFASLIGLPVLAQTFSRIEYLPFKIQTNAPVTRSTIGSSAFISINIKHQALPVGIRNLIKEGSPVPMDEKFVRLKITDGRTVYYFDHHGCGVRLPNSPVSINPIEFESFISQERISIATPRPEIP